MRTRPITLVLAIAALAGCASAPRVNAVQPAEPPALRVWVGYPIGSSRVHPIFTNREAYVAMFEIIPGRGVTMVYPFHRGHAGAADAHYADLTLQPGRMFYHTDPFGHAAYQPRYYYVVASVAPLNLAPLQSSLGAMRRVLGRMYASYRPYDVIDRLTGLVVPIQRDEDWATDLFVDWPAPGPMPIFASTRLVRCANGRVFQALNYPYHGCPGDTPAAVVASAEPTPPKGGEVELPRGPRRGGDRNGVELSDPGIDKRRRPEAGARAPRGGVDRDGIELSTPGVDKRRRAEAGAQPPGPASRARYPRDPIYASDATSGRSPKPSGRGSRPASSDPATAGRGSSGKVRSPEPTSSSTPARSGAQSGEDSGRERKP